ncbi:hypothetical protein ACIQGZ_08870 [Streptomyces sp. NPDC092296]|uniref:hypothetical protein n=1 Tax=Streptomyces sp. NPDC092296 TaxID=3366012 RepID=UPI00381524E6
MADLTAHCYTAPASDTPDHPGLAPAPEEAGPRADCVLCGEPTEHPVTQPGGTLCPVCTWQQAQRAACSG